MEKLNFNRLLIFVKGDLFKSSAILTFSSGIGALTRFLLVTVLARYFGTESYGVWVSITSVAAIMMFGDFGVTNALRNKLAVLKAQNDTDEIQREYFYTAFYFFLAFAIVAVLCFILVSSRIPLEELYKTNNRHLQQQGVEVFIFIQVVFLLNIPFGMVMGLFFSYGESSFNAFANILISIITFFSVLIASIVLKLDIVHIAYTYFGFNFLLNILVFIFFITQRGWWHSLSIDITKCKIRLYELLSEGVKFLGVQLSTSFIQNAPTIILGAMEGLSIAASFNIVQKLYVLFVTIYQSIFNPMWSKMTFLAGTDQWHSLKRLKNNMIIITLGVGVSATCFIYMFSEPIVNLVAGERYIVSRKLTLLLGVAFTLYAVFEATSILQNALGKLKLRLYSQILFVIILNVLIKFSLEYYSVNGVAILLIIIWGIMFGLMYFQGNYIIKNRTS